MTGDVEGAIGLDQKTEGTGKPDRFASAPRHRVGGDSTPCMPGLGKNNANGADRAGSVWIVGNPYIGTAVDRNAGSLVGPSELRRSPKMTGLCSPDLTHP